jgi:AcrR family transcriptional regulator
MEAAIRVIAVRGLSAPTMKIAEEARVANGSLFTYFATKADLFNQLYLELKAGMASASLDGLPAGADLRKRMFNVWSNWMEWRCLIRKTACLAAARRLRRDHAGDPHRRAQDNDGYRRADAADARQRPHAQCPNALRGVDHERPGGSDDGLHDPGSREREKALQGRLRRVLARNRLTFFTAQMTD